MAKLLGHDITTTQELQDAEKRILAAIESRLVEAEAKVKSHKMYFIVAAALAVLFDVMVVCLIVR